MTDSAASAIAATLADQFTAHFSPGLTGPRTVGREAEYPVVDQQGEAVDVRRLWETLMAPGDLTPKYEPGAPGQSDFVVALKGADFSYALEVGMGTIELNTRPCTTLFELREIQEAGLLRIVRAAARVGWRVLAYGIQPVSRPSLAIMSPKQRYLSLYRAMGATWLWYTVTASDQLHVAVTRPEMVQMLNFTNLMTPVIIALCANSPIHGGELSRYCSSREGEMAAIFAQEHRHGMIARAVRDMTDYVEMMSETTYLIVQNNNEIIPSSRPFSAYLAEHGADFAAFLFHEHYMWNSARLRTAYSTVEIRPACQQPWREHMAVSALGLGLVEAMPSIMAYLAETLGPNSWEIMREYHTLAIRHGLAAPQPAPGFVRRVLDLAHAGLVGRGFGEETLLDALYNRLARGMNPAQSMRAIYRSDGLSGLLNQAAVPPDFTTRSVL